MKKLVIKNSTAKSRDDRMISRLIYCETADLTSACIKGRVPTSAKKKEEEQEEDECGERKIKKKVGGGGKHEELENLEKL